MMKTRQRQSSMELLRIIAMALVVVCHTNYWSIGEPSWAMCVEEPVKTFAQYLSVSFAIVCVNCFVFISGWFSIKLTKRGFANLAFQLLFYSTLVYCALVLLGLIRFSVKDFLFHSDFMANFWFIRAYIPLFLLSPIFNVFIEKAGKRAAKTTLLAYAFLDVVWGWGIDYLHVTGGYTFFHLSFIYLLARYIKVYGGKWFSFDKWRDLSVYLLISVGTAVFVFLMSKVSPAVWNHCGRMFLYNSPLVIAASVYLALFFTKLDFKSRVVNMVGATSFAVFLIHGDPIVAEPYLKPFCADLFFNNSIGFFFLVIALLIIGLFVTAFLVDQIRQWLWRVIQKACF